MTALVNNIKTAILLGALFGLLIWVGSFWGGPGIMIAAIFGVIMNFGAWFYSDRIAIAAMRAKQVDEATAPELHDSVRRLSQRAGLPMPRVFICPHDAPNAFATGRNPRHAAVAFTQGALRLLSRDELEGVIAHELAHIKNRDTLTATIAATIAGIFSTLAYFAFIFGGRGQGGNPLMLIGVVLFGAVGAALLKAMISRSREYVADADGARIAGSPEGLVSALQKLESFSKRIPLQNPNPAMNNLFIVEPWVGQMITGLFATHPPIEKRVHALLRG